MSATFYLYRKQSDKGCDYMISCGESLDELEAKDASGAIEEARSLLRPNEYGESDLEFERDGELMELAVILQSVIGGDMLPECRKFMREKEQRDEEAAKAEKRKQLEKLKRELGEA